MASYMYIYIYEKILYTYIHINVHIPVIYVYMYEYEFISQIECDLVLDQVRMCIKDFVKNICIFLRIVSVHLQYIYNKFLESIKPS